MVVSLFASDIDFSTVISSSSVENSRTIVNLNAAKTPTGQIHLSWNAVTGAASYKVYYSATYRTTQQTGWTLLTTLTSSTLYYDVPASNAEGFFYVTYDNGVNIPANFILVQGGSFTLGTAQMTVSSFYIDKYELTQGEYQSVMGTNPAHSYNVSDDRPVYYISWFDAIAYCNKRSMQESLTPCYTYYGYGTNPATWPHGWDTNDNNQAYIECNWSASGYRLPTGMEWIFAAKGGNQSLHYTYSGSNDINAVAWWGYSTGGNSDFGCHIVGTKAPNELGIYDMSGNCWEYTWDRYGDFPTTNQTNYHGPDNGIIHEAHGGCWIYYDYWCENTYRKYMGAADTFPCVGFRPVRVIQ